MSELRPLHNEEGQPSMESPCAIETVADCPRPCPSPSRRRDFSTRRLRISKVSWVVGLGVCLTLLIAVVASIHSRSGVSKSQAQSKASGRPTTLRAIDPAEAAAGLTVRGLYDGSRPYFVFLGDSITEFSWNPSLMGWSAQIAKTYNRYADILNRGLSGYTTREALRVIEEIFPTQTDNYMLHHPPSLVTIFYGANDATLPGTWIHLNGEDNNVPIAEYQDNIRKLIAHVRKVSPDIAIVLITPPPTVDSPVIHHPATPPEESKAAAVKSKGTNFYSHQADAFASVAQHYVNAAQNGKAWSDAFRISSAANPYMNVYGDKSSLDNSYSAVDRTGSLSSSSSHGSTKPSSSASVSKDGGSGIASTHTSATGHTHTSDQSDDTTSSSKSKNSPGKGSGSGKKGKRESSGGGGSGEEKDNSASYKPIFGPMRTNAYVVGYAEAMKAVGEELDIPVIDTWHLLHGDQQGIYAQFLIDGLHLNSKGNDVVAVALLETIATYWPELLPGGQRMPKHQPEPW